MADEEPTFASSGRRRSRGAESAKRAETLERLKAIRQGGRRGDGGGFQIKLDAPIYDTVDEDEYDALVAKRREEASSFIVDDNGLGYGDLGEEEDWSQSGFAPSSDESDRENGRAQKRKKAAVEKKDPPPKKPTGLETAAAMMGKQRISSMFTSSVFKKSSGFGSGRDDRAKGLSCDSLVDDVIAEFAPDEADRERRRRGQVGSLSNSNSKGALSSYAPVPNVKFELLPTNGSGGGSVSWAKSVNVAGTGDSLDSKNLPDCCLVEQKDVTAESGNKVKLEHGLELDSNVDRDSVLQIENLPVNVSVAEEIVPETSETKLEPAMKTKVVHSLNAKVIEDKDPTMSATAGWKAARGQGISSVGSGEGGELNHGINNEDKPAFKLEQDGSLQFYMLDAYEEMYGANVGTLYLFGKVKEKEEYRSCCVVVRNMQRCVYAIPVDSVFRNDAIMKLENDVDESHISPSAFRSKLQDAAKGLKDEIAEQLLNLNVSAYCMTPVKRNYAFERPDIPSGENYVLKINYPFKDPPIPADLKGEHFRALLGTHCSPLELFLIKRKIKGPSWLSVSNFSSCPQQVSWCKFEVTVDCPKDIRISNSPEKLEAPTVVVTAINLKTIANEKQNVNEIVCASLICCHKVKIDSPMLASEWKEPKNLSHFTVVRKLEESIYPMGFTSKANLNVLSPESSERALLNRLILELYKLDSDVLVGHNISGFDLDILLHRVLARRVPSSMWSRIGRLKRTSMPKLTRGSSLFGSGASLGIMTCIAGRVLCDTYLSSRDLLKEVSYSLTHLAKTQLNKDRKEIAPHEIPGMFQTSDSLTELIEYGETDAWLSMELMFHLSVLPLTRQLTNISGNLWGKTLQGARAQRVEYLLLHAFHAKKYIVPDKISHGKAVKLEKRKVNHGVEDGNGDFDVDEASLENVAPHSVDGKGKKGPAYSGGLVLEPKRGLYDKFVLLLDFNSLYPSIIQEYNICFTTVERSSDGLAPCIPSNKMPGVLPELLKNLVERRRMVKAWQKNVSGLKFQQFDIQQQALKLTANSMYGCLGFSNSRFYAKPLAELITQRGREILQNTVDLVQNNLNLEVIYGDTDSIMIYSGLDDVAKATAVAGQVIKAVQEKYNCLKIDLDGLYKRMLLLKKKKYAAVKLLFKDGKPYEFIERKGLDMVRRDWSLLSKELGDFCLSRILSGGSCEDVIESIHNSLRKVQEDMRTGEVALEKYVITKSLTKPPEAYPDKNQPHVQVALRLRQTGYTAGCCAGDTVPYIICCEQGTSSGSSTGIASRARHPDELKRDPGKWMIDIDYYLSQQIHPVISRLCASIEGTSPARLADCLGLDSSKFQNKTSESTGNDPSNSLLSALDDGERYRGSEPLILSCPSCSESFECPTVLSFIYQLINEKPKDLQAKGSNCCFWHKLCCTNPKCPMESGPRRMTSSLLANQVKRQADRFISIYYQGLMMCDDESCKISTRSLNLQVSDDSERGTACPNPRCNGRLVRKYTEADLYKQLSYFCHVLDTVQCIPNPKVEVSTRIVLEKELARIRPEVDLAVSIIQKIRDRCAYGWVQLNDLFAI